MTVKGGTSQACAACKYQRRRCTQDCALAPYFPADKPKMFQNAHRLFGVCNIMKILKMLDDEQQKEEAMKSIIYEADVRARFPVYGCTWVIHQLNQQLMQCQNELFYVNSMLDGYRNSREHEDDPNSQFQQFGTLHETVDNDGYYGAASSEHLHHLQQYPHSYNNVLEGFVSNDQRLVESSDVKSLLVQQNNIMNDFTNNSYYDKIASSHNINGSFGMMQLQQLQQFHVPQSMPTSVDQHEIEVESHDYDDMPFVTHADDRQSYIESKDACESSAESILKDTMQPMDVSQNHDLKSAAARFSLTSVN